MRISLIHGQDINKSYEKFRSVIDSSKSKGFEIVNIKNPKEIVRISLFEEKTVFVLDKPAKVKPNDWKWLKSASSKYNSNLLIFYEGDAPATITRNLPKDIKLEKFDLPKILFTFLDSFYPKNSKTILRLLNDLVQNEPIELVFHLLSRRIRDLYWIIEDEASLPMQPWQKKRLLNIASKYSKKDIKNIINKLSEIDIKSKTSSNDLKSLLDIFILEELK